MLRASLEVLFLHQNTRHKATPNFFAAKVENFSGEKTHSLSRKQPNHYFFEKRHITVKPSFNLEFLCRVVMKQKHTPTARHKKHTHTHAFIYSCFDDTTAKKKKRDFITRTTTTTTTTRAACTY